MGGCLRIWGGRSEEKKCLGGGTGKSCSPKAKKNLRDFAEGETKNEGFRRRRKKLGVPSMEGGVGGCLRIWGGRIYPVGDLGGRGPMSLHWRRIFKFTFLSYFCEIPTVFEASH